MAHDEYRVTELVRAIAIPFERTTVPSTSLVREEQSPGSWRTIALTGKGTSGGPDLESL